MLACASITAGIGGVVARQSLTEPATRWSEGLAAQNHTYWAHEPRRTADAAAIAGPIRACHGRRRWSGHSAADGAVWMFIDAIPHPAVPGAQGARRIMDEPRLAGDALPGSAR
jgi:hypothetical protein